MDSALSPREIQSRIRSGESLADVAEAAGLPAEKIAAFADPIIAEREHVAQLARSGLLRKRGEGGNRSLIKVLTERMRVRRLDVDDLIWDAYRLPDRTWRVVAALEKGDYSKEAWFTYDSRGRFNVCANSDARWLVGEDTPASSLNPDEENTVDLNDELALVRATQPSDSDDLLSVTGDILAGSDTFLTDSGAILPENYLEPEPEPEPSFEPPTSSSNELDDIYSTLSAISEDSVLVYPGLAEIPTPDQQPLVSEPPLAEPEPVPAPQPKQPAKDQEPPKKKPTRRRRKRAKVPAWDDILFGAPPNKDN